MGLESVMNFFRPAAAQTPVEQLQQPAQVPNGQQSQAAVPNQDPTKVAADPAVEVSPLDSFKDIWQPKAKEEGAPEEFNPSKIFDLNAESMQKALSSVDFAQSVSEEQIAAIQQGGPEAVKAMMGMLNGVARQTMGAATQASAKMIETALTGAQGSLDKKISSTVRQNQVASHLQETNPALNHPAAAPLVQALQTQFSNQFPKASPQEVSKMVNDYMGAFANVAAGKQPETEAEVKGKGQDTDWDKYFSN